MFRIVMDDGGEIPSEWVRDYDIQVIPINIHFGEQTFLSGIDLLKADFYRLVERNGIIPKTSQPSPQQFIDFYQRVAKVGDTILSLHISSKLSGTFASAVIAARELAGKYNITPIDTGSGSAAVGFMCKEARLMERAGATLEKIVERLNDIRQNMLIIFTLNTLEYARMSGRVKALQATLASLLNVKPIVSLRDGMLVVGDRVRTRHKALEFILEKAAKRLGKRLVNAAVVHAEDAESGRYMMEKVRQILNCRELILSDLSIGVAANLGPGTIGIVAYPVEGG
jgi:DegV family protein with EDD domain